MIALLSAVNIPDGSLGLVAPGWQANMLLVHTRFQVICIYFPIILPVALLSLKYVEIKSK